MQRKWGIRKIVETLGFFKGNRVGNRHDCDATLKKVMLALDNELSNEEEKALLDEMNSCSHCLQKFEIEKSFKEYLCKKVKRHTVPSGVTDQIRSRIRNIMES